MTDAAGRERELFEAWVTSYNWNVMTNSDGYFHSPIVDMAWFVWQAARAPSGLAGRQQTTEQQQACENHEFAEHMSNQLSMPMKCGVCGHIVAAPRLLHSGSEKVAAAARNETPAKWEQAARDWFRAHVESRDHCELLRTALKRLTFAARTSGGTAGRDDELCAACDEAETVLAALPEAAGPNISNVVAVDVEVAAAIERLNTFAIGGHLYFGIVPDVRIVCAAASRAVGPPTQAARDVLAERERQVTVEGWTPEHDDEHRAEIQIAAACLCVDGTDAEVMWDDERADVWGLAAKHHGNWRRQLVIAGALILAAIERTDRRDAAEAAPGAVKP